MYTEGIMAIAELEVEERTKTCRICKETKPVSQFHRDRTRGDGYKARCAACSSKGRRKVDAVEARQSDAKSRANVAAIKRLVTLHRRDFDKLLADEYMKAGVGMKWEPYIGDSSVDDG